MKNIVFLFLLLFAVNSKNINAQGSDCNTAAPFCTAVPASFQAGTNTVAPIGPDYDCLGSQPNPAWFFLQVSTTGAITLDMSTSPSFDIDFVIWGPFTSAAAACATGLVSNVVDCSYSSAANETGIIPMANIGEVYVLLITNYSNTPTTILLEQTVSGGSGSTNCNIVCAMSSILATPGACISPGNTFDLTGILMYTAPPTSGTLTISNSSDGTTQVFTAPFNDSTVNFTLAGLPADGLTATVTAVFSSDTACSISQSFIAPPPCFVICPITVDSALTCDNVAVIITASGATSYLWSTGETTASIFVSGFPATYTVVGTTGTCMDTAVSIITTFPPPTVIFSADTSSGCNTFIVNFLADTSNNAGATYSWDFGDGANGNGINPSNTYSVAGCHTVSLTASFGQGCASTDSVSCMINVFPQSEANFNILPDEIDLVSPTAYFSNISTNATSWLWDFGDSTNSILQHPEHTFTDVGTYNVTLITSTINNCMDTITHTIEVKDIITRYIPNAFSPNKNDRNDIFKIYSFGISPDSFELLIFDRWGKQIFKTNDPNEGWNGSLNNNGIVLEMNTYIYNLNYVELTGKKRNIIGHVSLIR